MNFASPLEKKIKDKKQKKWFKIKQASPTDEVSSFKRRYRRKTKRCERLRAGIEKESSLSEFSVKIERILFHAAGVDQQLMWIDELAQNRTPKNTKHIGPLCEWHLKAKAKQELV
jgi:hypothetical protein